MLRVTESLKVTELAVEVHSLTINPFVYYHLTSIMISITYRGAICCRRRRDEIAASNNIGDGIAIDVVSRGCEERREKCKLGLSTHSFRGSRHLGQRDTEG